LHGIWAIRAFRDAGLDSSAEGVVEESGGYFAAGLRCALLDLAQAVAGIPGVCCFIGWVGGVLFAG
jgi:hypothetical protein